MSDTVVAARTTKTTMNKVDQYSCLHGNFNLVEKRITKINRYSLEYVN